MRLKTLLFNRGIFIQDIRNVGWISLAMLLCLLFSLPLQLLMAYTRENEFHHFDPPNSLFALSNDFQIFLIFTFPVLLAIFLFRYIQVKLSSDFTHSLPIKREHLFHQHALFGLLVLLVPIFITAISLFALGQFLPYKELLSFSSIFNWMTITALFYIFVFLAGVFVAMFTGMSLLQGALTYILFFFPVGVTILFVSNIEFYLFGFTSHYYLNQQLESLIPFIRITQLDRLPLSIIESMIYLLLCIVFYVAAVIAYKKRGTEIATQAIAFQSLRPLFKYGVTFCTMLVGGLYFGSLQGGMGWILFGYVTAAFLGYILATMILEKTWRVFSKWKGYAAYIIVMALLGFSLQLDMFGFEKKIPNVEDIQGVYFGESVYSVIDYEGHTNPYYEENRRLYIEPTYYYTESETIKNIHSLHEQIISEKKLLKNMSNTSNSVAIRYNLKNGDQIVRYYQLPISIYQKQYREIVELPEYRQNQNPVLKVDDLSNLNRISIHSYRAENRVTLTNPDDIEEFHQLIQADIQNQSYEETMDSRSWWSEISYEFNNNQYLQFSWKKSYTLIDSWLEEKGLLDQARVTTDDLSHVYIVKNEDNRDLHEVVYGNTGFEESLSEREDALKLANPDQLTEILEKSGGSYRGDYIVGFYFNNSIHPEFETITIEDAPDFLLKELP
ncbi:ABC transporter permease [Alkalihalobacillus sp. MEB130]|uniref:DUF6449 domain-containing protein n=1 Tax=Alkalihalobacillus sp. MEB130 TaxID=2976704 RepID=UPI0028DEE4E1|nr:DUF6449 domain-containing protein [Alkalihalobacillus sp. MEB130]MDT8861144.1 ABC transporter permease [Alkalihalobacillus sp. MEB130]